VSAGISEDEPLIDTRAGSVMGNSLSQQEMSAGELRRICLRRGIRLPAIAAMLAAGCLVLSLRPALAQSDDWTQVPSQPGQSRPAETAPAPASRSGAPMICGQLARPATEPYTSIIARIDQLWGVSTPVYEALRMVPPHINSQGCIFYNVKFMEEFLRGEANSHGQADKIPMIYAIMAHEVGHFMDHDFSAARRKVPSVTKELQADRFSGYTLERLGISHANITAYYSLGGDEFSPVHNHGFSNQRIAAFDDGWRRAEWNQPESGPVGIHGGEPGLGSDSNSQGLDTSATSEP
jgi:hypothetical protein